MKRLFDWQLFLALALLFLTTFFYFLHFLIFRDAHHIFIYFIGDLAFVFFEVLLVTLIIHRLLHHREEQALRKKQNMLMGAFFSEVGTELLRCLAVFEDDVVRVNKRLAPLDNWSESAFLHIRKHINGVGLDVNGRKGDLESITQLLQEKKNFLLSLLLNPMMPEYEELTNLIWAVFHLAEELEHQGPLNDLSEAEYAHLAEDMERVYHLLLLAWINFIKHMKANYPFLYSLAARTNPFDGSPASSA